MKNPSPALTRERRLYRSTSTFHGYGPGSFPTAAFERRARKCGQPKACFSASSGTSPACFSVKLVPVAVGSSKIVSCVLPGDICEFPASPHATSIKRGRRSVLYCPRIKSPSENNPRSAVCRTSPGRILSQPQTRKAPLVALPF